MDDTRLNDLKEKHPDGALLRSEDGKHEVFVRSPSRTDYRRFRSVAFDDKRRADALEQLLRACVVDPDAPGLDALLEKRPALAESFGEKLLTMAGLGKAEQVG